MGNSVGSLRKIVLDGRTYDMYADSKATLKPPYTTEGLATTGVNLMKMIKQVETIEGVELATTPQDMEAIKKLSQSLSDITMSLELADGSVYKGSGRIDFEGYETEMGKSKIKLIPRKSWTPFLR